MRRANITHSVLNAKYHEKEADIISRAGHRGMVTIATNMAGRGTDIKLGEGVVDAGGLYVIGTERHTSRRIDRQLRGRCARQGDPGRSKFFLSLEDDLMRLYSNQGFAARVLEGAFVEGEPLQHKLLNPAIERAQKSVEQHHYSIRKRLLQYDDVLNKQREVVYVTRNSAIHHELPKETIFELVEEELDVRMEEAGYYQSKTDAQSATESFLSWINKHFPVALRPDDLPPYDPDEVHSFVLQRIGKAYATKESVENPEALRMLERYVIINAIDRHWQDHLTAMEDLRQSVSLRSYGQKDPLSEYKSEAYRYFEKMMEEIRSVICSGLFRSATNIQAFENMLSLLSKGAKATGPAEGDIGNVTLLSQGGGGGQGGPEPSGGGPGSKPKVPKFTIKRDFPKVGRNDPCPCGSGKKYKKCCGR